MDFTKYIDDDYKYNAKCIDCYDGDTCKLNIDLGFGITIGKKSCRLFGIDTPELRGGTDEQKQKAKEARDFLRDQILDKDVVLYTLKDKEGKYGRLLGIIIIKDGDNLININQLMIDRGYATVYE